MISISYLRIPSAMPSRAQLLPDKRGRTVADYRRRSGRQKPALRATRTPGISCCIGSALANTCYSGNTVLHLPDHSGGGISMEDADHAASVMLLVRRIARAS